MRRRTSAVGAILAVLAFAPTAHAEEFAAHRAVYDVSLAGPRDLLEAARGLIAIEIKRGCDAWRYRQRIELETMAAGDESQHMSIQIDGQEALDGRTYAFHSLLATGGEDEISMVGRAYADGTGAVVNYTEPVPKSVALPADTAFGFGAIRRMVEAAASGAGQTRFHWFVGTGPREPLLLNAVISTAAPAVTDDPLLSGPRWRFSSAYFNLDADTPAYESVETIHANGVMEDGLYVYDGYALKLTLQRLEPLPAPECG